MTTRLTRSATATAAAAAAPKRHKLDAGDISGLFAFTEMGNRPAMEDCYSCLVTGDGSALVFGVFDGHGGDSCSLFCKEKLCQAVADHAYLHRATKQALTNVFVSLDEEYCDLTGEEGAGSTATAAVLRQSAKATKTQPAKYKLSVAWAGDSSAIILHKDSLEVEQITKNHNGSRPDERRRIEKQGGYCDFDPVDKIYRVDGVLAVTRSLGDATLKPHVCATPEIKELLVEPGDLVIMASDGLWDFCDLEHLTSAIKQHGFEAGLAQVVKHAASIGEDNVCVLGLDVARGIENLTSCD